MADDATEWEPDATYNPDRFYNAASNKYGVSGDARVAFPKSALGAMSAIVESSDTPYRNNSDLIRNGTYHQMHRDLEKLKEGRRDVVSLFLIGLDLAALKDEQDQAKRDFEELEEQLHRTEGSPHRRVLLLKHLLLFYRSLPPYLGEWAGECEVLLDKYGSEICEITGRTSVPYRHDISGVDPYAQERQATRFRLEGA